MTIDATLRQFARDLMRPQSDETPTQWCERNLYIPPPQTQAPGYLRLDGREYLREFIDSWGNPRITDEIACFGSQSGKTTALMAGLAWSIVNDPCGCIWAMPNADLARSFSNTRWMPIIDASPELAKLRPRGADRHAFKSLEQKIGAALLNFIGSNSPANLSSRPCRRVIADEVDKFSEGGQGEADAINLLDQRTKEKSMPQRFKTSTPTVVQGLIWQEFIKGDQRRYFVPCVHCGKFILLAWSASMNVMKMTGSESFVTWDKAARRADGSWDLARVERSARIECCHCGGHILDGQKTKMVRNGEWRPTAVAPAHFRSRHLSSLYASSTQTTFGALAVQFLQAKKSFMGLQGFINGALAEPYTAQDTVMERINVISKKPPAELDADWTKLLTVDYQQRAPFFWYVVRAWKDGNSEAVEANFCAKWEDLDAIQLRHRIRNEMVMVDSGYDPETVYEECAKRCAETPFHKDGLWRYAAMGWMPSKGMARGANWKNKNDVRSSLKEDTYVDPYEKTNRKGEVALQLLGFDADFFKDILAKLRTGRSDYYQWKVREDVATDEYWTHLDAEVKRSIVNRRNGKTTTEWQLRSERCPNHLLDCEVMQIALASLFGMFTLK